MMNADKTATKKRPAQEGMALVMVLGVVSVTMLLVVHIMTVCEIIAKEALVISKRSELRYQAESAADHAFWMHLTDKRLFPVRKLGSVDAARDSSDFEPWMADRRAHHLFDANCQVYIGSAEKSINIAQPDSLKRNIAPDDTDMLEMIGDFTDILTDYQDANSMKSLAGKENDDYAAEGYWSMPRDGAMQFAEELYWLDGWENAVTSEVTIIPPKGKSFSSNSGQKTSFFSATAADLQKTMDLTDQQLLEVLDARERWMNDSVELADSLSADLMADIVTRFSFDESNYAEISVSAASPEGEIRVLYSTVRETDLSKKSIFADSEQHCFSIWKRTVF